MRANVGKDGNISFLHTKCSGMELAIPAVATAAAQHSQNLQQLAENNIYSFVVGTTGELFFSRKY